MVGGHVSTISSGECALIRVHNDQYVHVAGKQCVVEWRKTEVSLHFDINAEGLNHVGSETVHTAWRVPVWAQV